MRNISLAALSLTLLVAPAFAENIKTGHPADPIISRSTAAQFIYRPGGLRFPAPRVHFLASAAGEIRVDRIPGRLHEHSIYKSPRQGLADRP